MKFPNVGKNFNIESENKVLDRKTFVYRLNDLKTPMDANLWEGALTHMFFRRCFYVGDSGLWNILKIEENGFCKDLYNSGQRVYGNDMEEQSG